MKNLNESENLLKKIKIKIQVNLFIKKTNIVICTKYLY